MSKVLVVAVGKITPTEKSITVLHGGLKEDPPAPAPKPSQPAKPEKKE